MILLDFGRLTEFLLATLKRKDNSTPQLLLLNIYNELLRFYLKHRKNFVSLVFEQKFTFSSLTTENPPPNDLQLFLRILSNGKAERSERIELLVSSIGQDLCRAATKGQWSQPKHYLLCLTLGHLSRSVKTKHVNEPTGSFRELLFFIGTRNRTCRSSYHSNTPNDTKSSSPIIISQRL